MKKYSKLTGLSLCSLLLSACANIGSMDFPGVYKIGLPQGNIITQEMIDQLRPGMTKRQVVFVMGTPLVRDPFNQDRWDYIYSFQPGGGERGQERVSVNFVEDALVSFTGDFTPTPDDSSATTETADNPETTSPNN
jgi:outer membrane protein assembly factor BamE